MKNVRIFAGLLVAIMSVFTLGSCNNDDDYIWVGYPPLPNALVTVKPIDGGGFYMQLDDSTTMYPVNMNVAPYGDKEVRALVSVREVKPEVEGYSKSVIVNWLDSILTKQAVPYPADGDVSEYGDDAIEIVRDWVNIAEDGFTSTCLPASTLTTLMRLSSSTTPSAMSTELWATHWLPSDCPTCPTPKERR